jgi:hypothetical protein
MAGQGIDVGDAVLTATVDMSQLEGKFAAIGDEAKAGLQPASAALDDVSDGFKESGAAATEAGEQIKTSMRGATEQVRFLGEETGIKLPRAMARLVGELPGVGNAINLAFEATAIIFAAEMVDSLTKKMFEFATAKERAYATEQLNVLIAENNEYVKQNKLLDDADKALMAAIDTRTTLQKLNTKLLDLQAELVAASKVDETETLNAKRVAAIKEQIRYTEVLIEQQERAAADKGEAEAIELIKRRQQELNQVQERYNKNAEEAERQTAELNKSLEEMGKTIKEVKMDVITPDGVKQIYDMREAAKSLGVTLRSDLVSRLNEARIAKDLFVSTMGTTDAAQIRLFNNAIEGAEKKLEDFGKKEEKLKQETAVTWASMLQDIKNGSTGSGLVIQQLGAEAQEGFNKMATGLQGAIAGALLEQGSFGKAMEQMTRSTLANLAAQALVKALFYTAEGTADLFTPGMEGAAAGMFEAAGLMAAVGAAAGVGAHAIPGGSSSSTNTGVETLSGESNTSGAGVRGGTSVRGFAAGALVSAPTLAMVGEGGGPEAVIPLDDPDSLAQIGEAVSYGIKASGGGGGDLHIHLPHGSIISADVMQKFVGKMNSMVKRGQLTSYSSNSLRVTRRSA